MALRPPPAGGGGAADDPRSGSCHRSTRLLPGVRPRLVPDAQHVHPLLGRTAQPLHPRQLVRRERGTRHGDGRDAGQADLRAALRLGAPLRVRPARQLADRMEPPGRRARPLGSRPRGRTARVGHAPPRRQPPAAAPAAGLRVPAVRHGPGGQPRARQYGEDRDRRGRRPCLRLARRRGSPAAPDPACRGPGRPEPSPGDTCRGAGGRPRGLAAAAGRRAGGCCRAAGGGGRGWADERRRLRPDPAGLGLRARRPLADAGLRRRRARQGRRRLRAPLRGAGPARAGRPARSAGPAGAARHRGGRRPQSVLPPRHVARPRPRRARHLPARRRPLRHRQDPAAGAARRRVALAPGPRRPGRRRRRRRGRRPARAGRRLRRRGPGR